jgi:hypothetical protein
MRLVPLTLVLASCAGALDTKVTLTPWCDNSMRVRISPSQLPPAAQAKMADLKAALAAKNMTDLAGALVEKCGPGAPISPKPGTGATHGNLAAKVGADGTLSFTRVDTGKLLFSAKASFELNGAINTDADAWTTMADKTAPVCSGSEFAGNLGGAKTAAECLALIKASDMRVNYGVWPSKNGAPAGCYICDLTDRGPPSTWKFNDMPGEASFIGPPLAKLGQGL